jgi:hypothetical protein
MNDRLAEIQKELKDANEAFEKGDGLTIHQQVAKDVVRIERSFFYSDRNNSSRLEQIRVAINTGFLKYVKEDKK